jgi:hypothetical protein
MARGGGQKRLKPPVRNPAGRQERSTRIARALQSAFPLPGTGMFSDLLAAIDNADSTRRRPARDQSANRDDFPQRR